MIRTITLALLILLATAALATARTLIELDEPFVGELKVVGFELAKEAEIDISAKGLMSSWSDKYLVYAWIIDHETREPIWSMKDRWKRKSRRASHEIETTRTIPAGKYELYLYAGDNAFGGGISIKGLDDIWDFLDGAFDSDNNRDRDRHAFLDDDVEECYVRLESTELGDSEFKTFEVSSGLPGALINHTSLGDSEYIETGFTMKEAGQLRIYAILEYPEGDRDPVDYGWIVEVDSRDKVWEIDRWNTDYAGGGDKNQVHDEEISLEKGSYILYWVTDDSHSFESFNVNPPYDPLNWGVQVLPGKGFSPSKFADYEIPSRGKPLIDFTKARNDKYYEQAFSLSRRTDLNIYAVGEMARSSRTFADYGSIIDAVSGEVVWEMSRRNTEHAGGNEKNRLFDGVVTLDKGSYIAAYVTDDSHAYRSFNASPPFQPRAYGMAVFAGAKGDGGFKLVDIDDIAKEEGLLVSIVRVRDNERLRRTFSLDKDAWIKIYALGEGDRGDMYDYAWIVNDKTGRDVWEMTWRNTFHAGGARKNRVYDDDIYLEAGEYEVTYITDGSHSFNDWNADRPDDPHNWGIKISLAKR